MNSNQATQGSKLLLIKAFIFTILTAFCVEIIYNLFLWITTNQNVLYSSYYIYHQLWEIIALVGIIIIVCRLGCDPINFLASLVMTIVCSTIFVIVFFSVISPKYFPNISLLKTNYIGVYDSVVAFLYPVADCPYFTKKNVDLQISKGLIRTQNFFSWKTGLAFGFIPDNRCIQEFKGYDETLILSKYVSNFLTIGPVFLFELFIKSLTSVSLATMIFIQIVWYVFHKEYMWWEIDGTIRRATWKRPSIFSRLRLPGFLGEIDWRSFNVESAFFIFLIISIIFNFNWYLELLSELFR